MVAFSLMENLYKIILSDNRSYFKFPFPKGAIRSASQFRQGCEGSDPAVFAAAADFAGQIDQKSINKHGSP
jgi:hypothetical protein